MWGYMWEVREWSGLVLSGKDRSGGESECHVHHYTCTIHSLCGKKKGASSI